MDKIEIIIDRVKSFANVDKDNELADLFGLSAPEFSRRKKRGTLLQVIVQWGIGNNANLNWLLTGQNGNNLVGNQNDLSTEKIVDLERSDVSRTFKNKTLVKEINQILKEIEDLDETHLREIKGLLRAELSQMRRKPDRRSGEDRRKKDVPELIPEEDRRSGIERRVAGLNS